MFALFASQTSSIKIEPFTLINTTDSIGFKVNEHNQLFFIPGLPDKTTVITSAATKPYSTSYSSSKSYLSQRLSNPLFYFGSVYGRISIYPSNISTIVGMRMDVPIECVNKFGFFSGYGLTSWRASVFKEMRNNIGFCIAVVGDPGSNISVNSIDYEDGDEINVYYGNNEIIDVTGSYMNFDDTNAIFIYYASKYISTNRTLEIQITSPTTYSNLDFNVYNFYDLNKYAVKNTESIETIVITIIAVVAGVVCLIFVILCLCGCIACCNYQNQRKVDSTPVINKEDATPMVYSDPYQIPYSQPSYPTQQVSSMDYFPAPAYVPPVQAQPSGYEPPVQAPPPGYDQPSQNIPPGYIQSPYTPTGY